MGTSCEGRFLRGGGIGASFPVSALAVILVGTFSVVLCHPSIVVDLGWVLVGGLVSSLLDTIHFGLINISISMT